MKIFISYATPQLQIAERISLTLTESGHDIFLDKKRLAPGSGPHEEIRQQIDTSDAIVFLVSPEALEPTSYPLAELTFAAEKWKHPKGRVLPVETARTARSEWPEYLKAVTPIWHGSGDPAALVAATIAKWSRLAPISRDAWQKYIEEFSKNQTFRRWSEGYIDTKIVRRPGDPGAILPITVRSFDFARRSASTTLLGFEKIALDPQQRRMLLLGGPGSGKTTSLERLAQLAADRALASLADQEIPLEVPIFVNLRDLQGDVFDFMATAMGTLRAELPLERPFNALLTQNSVRLLLLLDSLNEVRREDRETCKRGILELLRNDRHRFVIACRVLDYDETPEFRQIRIEGFLLQALEEADIVGYLDNLFERKRGKGGLGARKYFALKPRLRELVRIPLHLAMLADVLLRDDEIRVRTRGELLDRFITDRLRWEQSKDGRSDETPIQNVEDKRLALAVLANHTLSKGIVSFGIPDRELVQRGIDLEVSRSREVFHRLEHGGLIGREGERLFSWMHQSVRDFAAAEYLQYALEDDPRLKRDVQLDLGDVESLANLPDWSEPLTLLCGIEPTLGSKILRRLALRFPMLAGRCVAEGLPMERDAIVLVLNSLLRHFADSEDLEAAGLIVTLWKEGESENSRICRELCEKGKECEIPLLSRARILTAGGRLAKQTGKWPAARDCCHYAREILENAFDSCEAAEPEQVRCCIAQVLSEEADLDDIEGSYQSGGEKHEKALELATKSCSRIVRAEMLNRYGYNLRYRAQSNLDWGKAYDTFSEANELAESDVEAAPGRQASVTAESLMGVGKILLEQGKFMEAKEYLDKAEERFRRLGDDHNLAQAIHKAGEALLGLATQGDIKFEVARAKLEESLAIKRRRGDLFGIGISFEKIGRSYELEGPQHFSRALDAQEESLRVKEAMGNRDSRGCVLSLCAKARISAKRGEIEVASETLTRVDLHLRALPDDWEMRAEYHATHGLIASETKDWEVALLHLEKARHIYVRTQRSQRVRWVNDLIDGVRTCIEASTHCPLCGNLLRFSGNGRQLHRRCPDCRETILWNPKLGAACLLIHEDKVVLVKRRAPPFKGWWTLIAGYVEYDESPRDTAIRKVQEEAGVKIMLEEKPLGIYHFRDDPRADMILIVYVGKIISGSLRTGDDAAEVEAFIEENVPWEKIAFAGTREALAEFGRRQQS